MWFFRNKFLWHTATTRGMWFWGWSRFFDFWDRSSFGKNHGCYFVFGWFFVRNQWRCYFRYFWYFWRNHFFYFFLCLFFCLFSWPIFFFFFTSFSFSISESFCYFFCR